MPHQAIRDSSHQPLRPLLSLCCAGLLLAVLAVGNTSSSERRARQNTAQEHERQSQVRREVFELDEFTGRGEFNFTRLYYFIYYSFSLKQIPPTFVLDEATELMHSLTRVSSNISFVDVIEEILLGALRIDSEFLVAHQDGVTELVQSGQNALLALQLPIGYGSVFVGDDVHIAVLSADDNFKHTDVTLCTPRNKPPSFEEIITSNDRETKNKFDGCHFALTLSNARLQNSRIAVIAYPVNRILRPMPSIEYPILNSRVLDIALSPKVGQNTSEDQLLTIFFKTSLNATTKRCSYWNKTQGSWTTEGCWVDLGTSHDICYCNLSAHLKDDANGGQYIVYEHSDVFFNTSSYEYLMDHDRDVTADSFISEASALMHNITLVPGSRTEHFRMSELVAKTLRISSQLPQGSKTEATMKNIQQFYANARNVFKSSDRLPSWEIGNNVLIVFRKVTNGNESGLSFALQNNFNVKYRNYTQIDALRTVHDGQVTYALTASRSVAEQNEQVAYMLFPIDKFLFKPIKKVGHLQVHNFRVIDILLVPRAGVRNMEHQYIDIWYRPSVSNAFAKDVRFGCAYWSNDSVWTTDGCVVLPNVAPRGCRCNLSAHFEENREGGQYVAFEYSDVILDYERIESIEPSIGMSFKVDLILIEELVTFIHNLTQVGYLSTDALQHATVIALRVLGFNQPVLKLAGHLLVPMVNDLHYMVCRWASDDNAVYSNLFGTYYHGSITTPFAVSLEANDVLSNEVLRTRSSLLHQTVYFVTRLGLALSNIGVKVTSDQTTYLRVPASPVVSPEQQLSYYFSAHSADRVRFTVVMYPNSKSYLPLYGTLPAIFSCHFLDVTIISEENTGNLPPSSSRVITLVYVSGEPRSTGVSTGCSVWTNVGWSASTCWQEIGNEHACSCNLSAHALSNGTFLPVLIYESPQEANFSFKTSLIALDVLYVVSSLASLIGLALIALIAVVFPQWRDDVGHKILLHMSLALFLYQTLRIYRETHHVYTAMNRDVEAFVAFTAVTHYSRLTHYSWMLAMAWLQLRRLITVVGASDIPHLLMKVSVVAWGVPLVPLAVLLSWNREEHFAQPDKATHLVLYLVPGAVVTLVNVIILGIILARLFSWFGWGKMEDLARHGISGGMLTRRRLATAVLLVFLFGLPTVFEMLNDFWGHSLTLEVLFKVFDPVRGAIVFVYFVLLDRKTFEMWREKVRSLGSSNATQDTDTL